MPSHPGRALAFVLLMLLAALPLAGNPASAGTVPTFFVDELFASGFSTPRAMEFLPSGDLLVTDKAGTLRIVENGTTRTVMDISDRVNDAGNEQGLLGLAIDPAYPARPYIYVHYDGPNNLINISRFTVLNASGPGPMSVDPGSEYVYLGDIPDDANNHNGGTVRFGPDGRMYVSLGEDADPCDAQNLTLLKGKILRLNVNDSADNTKRSTLAPDDNPFVNQSDPNARLVYAYGLRNPFRFDIDMTDGLLYIGDVGQGSWEEIDISAGGENFGWPYYEGNHTMRTTACSAVLPLVQGILPIYEYPNPGGASVIMSTLYRGRDYPTDSSFPSEFDKNPMFTDFYSGNLRVLRENASGPGWDLVAGMSATNFGTNFAGTPDSRVGPDGAFYYIASYSNQVRRVRFVAAPVINNTSLPEGTTGVQYDALLQATGGSSPFNWSISSGSLPDGLLLDGANGTISGIPTAAANYTFTVRVDNTLGRNSTRALFIEIRNPITFTRASLPGGMVNRSYAETLGAAGGDGDYTWSAFGAPWPTWLIFNPSTATVSGLPATAGSFAFTVHVEDSAGRSAERPYSIDVAEELRILNTGLPQGEQFVAYSAQLSATGGSGVYNWSIAAGSLPANLTFDNATGALSGTPSVAAAVRITFLLLDLSLGFNDTVDLDLVIAPPPGGDPLISTTSIPTMFLNGSYSVSFEVVGGQGPYAWTLVSGALPLGISFDNSTAVLAGTASQLGSFTVNVEVADSFNRTDERAYTFDVIVPPGGDPFIPLPQIPPIPANISFVLPMPVAGGLAPFTWTIVSGDAPPGMTFALNNGTLYGVATSPGVYQLTLRVTDSYNRSSTRALDIVVAKIPGRITIEGADFGNLTLGHAVAAGNITWRAENLTGSLSWNATGLPPGVSMAVDGSLSGTPTANGTFTVFIQVHDANDPPARANFTVNVTVRRIAVAVQTLPQWDVGGAVVFQIEALNLPPGAVWAIVGGELPPGLRLDANGAIRGTPTAPGNFTFVVTVTDPEASANSASVTLTASVVGDAILPREAQEFPWLLAVVAVVAMVAVVAVLALRRRNP